MLKNLPCKDPTSFTNLRVYGELPTPKRHIFIVAEHQLHIHGIFI